MGRGSGGTLGLRGRGTRASNMEYNIVCNGYNVVKQSHDHISI